MQKSTKTEQEDRGTRDALTALMRAGARKLIAQALDAEVAELLVTYADQQDEPGRGRPQRSPPREGDSDGDRAVDGASSQSPQSSRRAGHHLPLRTGSALCAQAGELGGGDPLAVFQRHLDRGDASPIGIFSGPRDQGPRGQYRGPVEADLA